MSVIGTSKGNVIIASTNYLMNPGDFQVIGDTSGIAVTLPTAIQSASSTYEIKNVSDGSITVNTTSGQTIDGELSLVLYSYENLTVASNNSNWVIL